MQSEPLEEKCGFIHVERELQQKFPNRSTTEEFERWMQYKIDNNEYDASRAVKTIPVVVHIIHNGEDVGTGPNITEEQVLSQIDVLNEDYRRLNVDAANTPDDFIDDAVDVELEFCLATVTPDGEETNGIHRYNGGQNGYSVADMETAIKPATIWDPEYYFNIWVCNLYTYLGYAQFPDDSGLPGLPPDIEQDGTENTDGIVIKTTSFGTVGNVSAPYHLGRTATHEAGHFFGLRHIWGDKGDDNLLSCDDDDFCDDTPFQYSANFTGSPCTYPGPNSCFSGDPGDLADQFMNFLDYSDDECMNMFTADQKTRIDVVIANSPRRNFENSFVCNGTPPGGDNTPPIAACQDVSVSADEGCLGYVSAEQIDNGSYDPDGDPITLSLNPPGPYSLGVTEVTLMVEDGFGGIDQCLANVHVMDVTPPDITCPSNISSGNDPGLCSATIEFEVTAADNCDTDVTILSTPASGSTFPVGTTTVVCTATDDSGNTATCSFDVIVLDVDAPEITVFSEPLVLWPPNHKYETVYLAQMVVDVSDNCDELSIADIDIVQVSSDEPENDQGDGDGNTINDIIISSNCNYVDLRKERMGPGNGRVYDISLYVADDAGNVGTALFSVMVPHDIDNYPAVNDGPLYTVNGNCQGLRNITADIDSKTTELFNYPNPFNESTIIQFRLQKSEQIRMIVYNSQGKEVATLFEGIAEAERSYRVEFNGLNLPAGLYYYHLQSYEGIDIVKKMMLIK